MGQGFEQRLRRVELAVTVELTSATQQIGERAPKAGVVIGQPDPDV